MAHHNSVILLFRKEYYQEKWTTQDKKRGLTEGASSPCDLAFPLRSGFICVWTGFIAVQIGFLHANEANPHTDEASPNSDEG